MSALDYWEARELDYLEARADARMDAYLDELERVGWTCADCGTLWDPRHHPATRWDPAWVECDTCPSCGGEAAGG